MERFGFHRVLGERPSTPQAAEELSVALPARDSELVLDVELLNLDSTSAAQLHGESEARGVPMAELIRNLVAKRGKQHNPVTNSGGVLMGRVRWCGPKRKQQLPLGALVVPLCSLTAIPLALESIARIAGHQVFCKGTAVLYESLVVAEISAEHSRRFGLEAILAAIDVSRLVPQLRR